LRIFSHLQMTWVIRLRIHSEAGYGFRFKLTPMGIAVPLRAYLMSTRIAIKVIALDNDSICRVR